MPGALCFLVVMFIFISTITTTKTNHYVGTLFLINTLTYPFFSYIETFGNMKTLNFVFSKFGQNYWAWSY
jgi:hypothetical protein